jgi:hypothetical protein
MQPLFPGYIFLRVVAGWWSARWSTGVVRIITGAAGTPAHVPASVIDGLRARERGASAVIPAFMTCASICPKPAVKRGRQAA